MPFHRKARSLYLNLWWPNLLTHICVVWPQWVNLLFPFLSLFAGWWYWRYSRWWSRNRCKCADLLNYDVITWKRFPHHWLFLRRTHRSLVDSLHKGLWSGFWCFLWCHLEQTAEQTIVTQVNWNIFALIRGHMKGFLKFGFDYCY